MTAARHLHLDILPSPQRRLWPEFKALPPHFVLYGGTAIALQLGHRHSIDFDFFSNQPLDTHTLDLGLPFLEGADVTQRAPNSLSVIIDRDGPVKVSFFGVPRLPRLEEPIVADDTGLRIASLSDLAGTKLSVVQMRAEAKDYIDIDALLTAGKFDLARALACAAALYGASFSHHSALKALTYFEDQALDELPVELKLRLVAAVKHVDLNRLPQLPPPFYRPSP